MGTVISNLKARFGVDTSDFKKGLKDGEKAVDDFKGAAGSQIEAFASMFGVNMSAVNDAVNTAGKSLSFIGQSLTGVKKGGEAAAVGVKILKVALISTGFGAIVVVLGTIIAYFTKTGEGADKFAKILSQVKSIVNNVIDRLAIFGKGLFELMTGKFQKGWETMKGAFKGIGDEIREDWKAAGALADREDALEDREISLIKTLEERRAKISDLRKLAKEEIDDQQQKLALLDQVNKLIKGVYGDEISLERERLSIMKEKLALQTSDPTDEQLREIAEQEAMINGLLRSQNDELRGITRERNAAVKAVQEMMKLEKINPFSLMGSDSLKPKLPEGLNELQHTQIQTLRETSAELQDMYSLTEASIENLATGFGEWAGAFSSGMSGFRDMRQLVGNTFGDMLIQLGTVAIKTGIGLEAIKKAFTNPLTAGIGTIGIGMALVAFGASIKGSIAQINSSRSAASEGSFSTKLGGGSATFGALSGSGGKNKIMIDGTVDLKLKGSDLVALLNNENTRIEIVT